MAIARTHPVTKSVVLTVLVAVSMTATPAEDAIPMRLASVQAEDHVAQAAVSWESQWWPRPGLPRDR
jgi:hypothetical protein